MPLGRFKEFHLFILETLAFILSAGVHKMVAMASAQALVLRNLLRKMASFYSARNV